MGSLSQRLLVVLPKSSDEGSVEKSRQQRSRRFPVLTYYPYAPRTKQRWPPSGCPKQLAALLNELF